MSVLTPHQTDLTTFCKFKREHKLRRALHLSLNPNYAISPPPCTALSMTNDEQAEVPGQTEEIDNLAGNERNKGAQPIAELMQQYDLKPKDLVEASAEQLTFKLVARAMKGRELTINSKGIVQRAMNRATSKVWTQKQLFNY